MRILIDIWHKTPVMEAPARCSGLPPIRYVPELLDQLFPTSFFALIASRNISFPSTCTKYLLGKLKPTYALKVGYTFNLRIERPARTWEVWERGGLGSSVGAELGGFQWPPSA